MYPVLFKIGNISIYTYGMFMAIAFLTGIMLAKKEAERLGEDPEKIMDLCFIILISSIIFARLFYVFTAPEVYFSDPLEIFRIWNGGLVYYGAFIGALITAIVYVTIRKMPIWKVGDILAPSLAIGQFFGRIGCFFAGCCYGRQCSLPWAVVFTHPESLARKGVPLHPTQLYSSLANLILFTLLWSFRKRKSFDGQLFWVYAMLYGITRTIIEFYRGDFRGPVFLEVFSVSQILGITMSLISMMMLIYLRKQSK